MDVLAASIRYWVVYKLNTDPAWAMVGLLLYLKPQLVLLTSCVTLAKSHRF